jgi:hypothetical protein
MRKEATAVIIAAIVVASLGIGYYSGSSGRSAERVSARTSSFSSETSPLPVTSHSTSSLSTTVIAYSTTVPTMTFGSCWQGSPESNSTTPDYFTAYYNFTSEFKSGQWNGTSFQLGGYNFTAVGHGSSPQNYYYAQLSDDDTQEVTSEVVLEVSNGQTNQNMTFLNVATPFPIWPPDFPEGPVGVFSAHVVAQWYFTCANGVILGVSVFPPSVARGPR